MTMTDQTDRKAEEFMRLAEAIVDIVEKSPPTRWQGVPRDRKVAAVEVVLHEFADAQQRLARAAAFREVDGWLPALLDLIPSQRTEKPKAKKKAAS